MQPPRASTSCYSPTQGLLKSNDDAFGTIVIHHQHLAVTTEAKRCRLRFRLISNQCARDWKGTSMIGNSRRNAIV